MERFRSLDRKWKQIGYRIPEVETSIAQRLFSSSSRLAWRASWMLLGCPSTIATTWWKTPPAAMLLGFSMSPTGSGGVFFDLVRRLGHFWGLIKDMLESMCHWKKSCLDSPPNKNKSNSMILKFLASVMLRFRSDHPRPGLSSLKTKKCRGFVSSLSLTLGLALFGSVFFGVGWNYPGSGGWCFLQSTENCCC